MYEEFAAHSDFTRLERLIFSVVRRGYLIYAKKKKKNTTQHNTFKDQIIYKNTFMFNFVNLILYIYIYIITIYVFLLKKLSWGISMTYQTILNLFNIFSEWSISVVKFIKKKNYAYINVYRCRIRVRHNTSHNFGLLCITKS